MSKEYNILTIGWEYPPEYSGGLGIACQGIITELAKKGHKVNLILPTTSNTDSNNIKFINSIVEAKRIRQNKVVKIDTIWINSPLNPYLNETTYESLLESIAGDNQSAVDAKKIYSQNLLAEVTRYASIVEEISRNYQHDIIHAHDWLTILAALNARKHSGKPVIFHVHALEIDRSGEHLNTQIYDIEKHGLINADHIITVSNYSKNRIKDHYHIPENKISVVHNGLSFAEENLGTANSNNDIVLFVGRITYQKGPWYFIETAKKVLEKRPHTKFVIAGSGDLLPSLIEQVALQNLNEKICFTGFLGQQEVRKLFSMSSVFVMPSVSEPFGLSCLEAVQDSVPVIISKQSGVSEVIKHALKVDFWDTVEMANKILAVLEYKHLGGELVNNASSEINQLSWTAAVDKILNVYKQVYQGG